MYSAYTVLLVIILYGLIMFLFANRVDKAMRRQAVKSLPPWFYALSLAVFCTTWTYYGSVGFAVHSGLLFLAVHLGAILGVLCWWKTLRRMVAVKQAFRLTSVADFISTRYRRSQRTAIMVTLIALCGIAPYIALQLSAIVSSVSIMSGQNEADFWSLNGLIIIAMMLVFTLLFGIRKLDPTEKHSGIVAVLVVEAFIKLIAMAAVAGLAIWSVYGGPKAFMSAFNQESLSILREIHVVEDSGLSWLTLIVLGMAAVHLLPRQFHVQVVESSDQAHVKSAMYLFPIYLIIINLFVFPVAAAGITLGLPIESADYFMLLLPKYFEQDLVTLLAFIGGLAAAMGMIIVSTMTLATMTSNHLVLPLTNKLSGLEFLQRYLLQVRWVAAALVLISSYFLASVLTDDYLLTSIGFLSFAAILQLVPAGLLGMFWRRGNSVGAMTGLFAGYIVWGWTLIVPSMIQQGWLPESILTTGAFGWSILRPEALFGLSGLPSIVHGVFWSLLFNMLFYLFGSWFYKPGHQERSLTREFVHAMYQPKHTLGKARPTGLDAYIPAEPKLSEAYALLSRYLGESKARDAMEHISEDLQIKGKSYWSVIELMEYHRMLEHLLAGSIGAASAHQAMEERIHYDEREAADLQMLFSHIAGELKGQLRMEDGDIEFERSNPSGYGMVQDLQSQLDEQQKLITEQQRRIIELESVLDERHDETFKYRMDAQKLRLENDNLRRRIIDQETQPDNSMSDK